MSQLPLVGLSMGPCTCASEDTIASIISSRNYMVGRCGRNQTTLDSITWGRSPGSGLGGMGHGGWMFGVFWTSWLSSTLHHCLVPCWHVCATFFAPKCRTPFKKAGCSWDESGALACLTSSDGQLVRLAGSVLGGSSSFAEELGASPGSAGMLGGVPFVKHVRGSGASIMQIQ
ncbi:hypothetical protein DPEC_G00306130 [Dallia pectoralis]|uniref:Uncharacterized protein n=1 Tax=Dallia pectoralis TaxID=75939 RepID=A0ACC2FE07_DALPE|nr:hypothetical protein DPEC_G00306130 [Dallia pectoralis]